MPFFRFACDQCPQEKRVLTTYEKAKSTSYSCGSCTAGSMKLRMGAPAALGKVTIDESRGISVEEGLRQKLLDRAHEHHIRHDIPRIIDKQGLESAVRDGFVDIEGNPIDKRRK